MLRVITGGMPITHSREEAEKGARAHVVSLAALHHAASLAQTVLTLSLPTSPLPPHLIFC